MFYINQPLVYLALGYNLIINDDFRSIVIGSRYIFLYYFSSIVSFPTLWFLMLLPMTN